MTVFIDPSELRFEYVAKPDSDSNRLPGVERDAIVWLEPLLIGASCAGTANSLKCGYMPCSGDTGLLSELTSPPLAKINDFSYRTGRGPLVLTGFLSRCGL